MNKSNSIIKRCKCGELFRSATGRRILCDTCQGGKMKRNYGKKKCKMCGETFNATSGRAIYCIECRPTARRRQKDEYQSKKTGKAIRRNTIDQCGKCGGDYLVITGRQKYCRKCQKDPGRGRRSEFTCEICGGTFEQKPQANKNQKLCVDKCEPMPGLVFDCAGCGDPLPYEAFSDYRSSGYRFHRTCKRCMTKRALKAYHKKALLSQSK